MEKLVVLSVGNGSVSSGFASVRAQLWEATSVYPIQVTGALPAAPHIPTLYRQWQLLYLALYHRLGAPSRIKIKAADITNVSEMEFDQFCQHLSVQTNIWLSSEEFRPIEQKLRTWLNTSDEIRIIIETNDPCLRQLPWHQWKLFDHYPHAELALSVLDYQRVAKTIASQTGSKVRILAILGDSQDININQDRAYLEQLTEQAEIHFLVKPGREEVNEQLWQRWDILFFAGHSVTQETGYLRINPMENLSLEQLRWALSRAIANGLKLAIFNSCDGLGLAQSLADLHIPQVIVMREPVPDVVAQEFLKHFLTAFVTGRSLYTSVREARERLQGMEGSYPCASWLPVICQNPAEAPMRWGEWTGERGEEVGRANRQLQSKLQRPTSTFFRVLLSSLIMTILVMGVRYLGVLQTWELKALDQLMQLRSQEPPDQRLLVVTVTEDDFHLPEQQQRKGSLSDEALARLLEKLTAFKPRAIGLDIYRDFPVETNQGMLANQLRQNAGFFAICKGKDTLSRDGTTDHPGIAPPPEVPVERQGFSDLVKDPDEVLRRHLLVMDADPASPCTTPYALSAQLAFYALAAEGISVSYNSQGELQVEDVVLQQLHNHAGGYHRVDTWGYQILLNYRAFNSPRNVAPTVTLEQVLTDQIKPEDIRDRIVLIGVSAPSAGDYLLTPYRPPQNRTQGIPGVFAQAQMVSQLISAVKDKRPLLVTWSTWQDFVWVWIWAFAGGILVIYLKPSRFILFASASITLLTLLLLCFYLLTQGKWVPLIPSILASIGTGSCIVLLNQRKSEKQSSFR